MTTETSPPTTQPSPSPSAPAEPTPEAAEEEPSTPPTLPPNWPPHLPFLTTHTYTPIVTPSQKLALSRPPSPTNDAPRIPPPTLAHLPSTITIAPITTPTHPAYPQHGLFTTTHLAPDALVTLYLGRVHTNALSDTDPHSDYDLSLDRELGLSVDAAREGNWARFCNDYRGVKERPNAEFRDCFVRVPGPGPGGEGRGDRGVWERRVGIFVLGAGKKGLRKRGIGAGEEVLVSYGKGFWEGRRTMGAFRGDVEMLRQANAALAAD